MNAVPALARYTPFQQTGVEFDPVAHRYSYLGYPVLGTTSVMRAHHLSADWSHVDAEVLERKRELGLAVHAATHFDDEGDLRLQSLAPSLVPYVDAWRRFKDDSGFEPILLETLLVHPVRLYGSIIDRWGPLRKFNGDDLPATVDLKTGNPDDACARVQTAAYQQNLIANLAAVFTHLTACGVRLPWSLAELFSAVNLPRYSVQLQSDGKYQLRTYRHFGVDVTLFNAALACEANVHPSWRQQS